MFWSSERVVCVSERTVAYGVTIHDYRTGKDLEGNGRTVKKVIHKHVQRLSKTIKNPHSAYMMTGGEI